MKKTLSVLLSILMVVGTVSCCFGVTAAAADEVIAFRYDALGFTEGEDGLAANIDFGKNIIRGFGVGVEDYDDYITAGKDGLYPQLPQFETGRAIGTGDHVKVTTEQGAVVADYETVVYGDLDGDGYLDVLDAVLVERISTGAYAPTESDFADGGMSYAAFVEAADVNGDGEIDVTDFSALVDAALGGAEIDQRRVEASWVENVHTEIEAQAFTGLEITPDLDVNLCGKLLEKDSDYEVSFSENIEIGEAYITVSAKKDSLFSGEKTFKFEIKSIIEIVCREIGTMLEKCRMNNCISVSYNAENAAVDVIFDGEALLALELNPDRTALTGVYSELMSLFGKIYAERKLTVGGVTVGEKGVKNYAGINELKNELRNALRSFENAEENLVKSFDGVIASETVNENFKVNVKFNCSDAGALGSGLAALDGFVVFGADELDSELTVIDVNIPEAFARKLAAEYEDIYGAVEGFGAMDVNTFIGKFAGLETTDITAENGSVINMFADAFGKMNILVTDILAERDISISANGSEYINAYNGNAFNSENGSTADVGSFIAALGELADLEGVKACAFSDGRGDYCVYVKVGYADSKYVKNYKLNLNVFGALVDELENSACDYTALTNAINNANTVLSGGTAYTSASLAVVNGKLNAANGVPAGLLKGVDCENQKLIDDTAEELNLAVAALINKADYTKLNEAKSAAAVVKADGKDYTDDTMAALDKALSDAAELSDDLSFEYQQTVDGAAKAINDAIAALKINADYTALENAKTAAAEKKNDGKVYTTATMSVLDDALTAAEGVPAGLTSENQQLIDNAAAAINTAIEGLKEKADYSALEAAKESAAVKKADGNDYTEDTMATLDTALAAAAEISDDLSVECQQTVTNAANAINDAIAALKINADYTALDKAKEDAAAKKSDPKIYTDATLLVLETALNAANEIPADLTSENQQLIDNAAAAINNAIAALEEKADYMQLDAAKQAAANVSFATYIHYTEDSLAAFNTALENANALSDDLSVDYQQVIDDAAAALNDAITSLKIKADYNALNEAKVKAAEIKSNGKVYTTATMSVLDSALADAAEVPENLTSESQQTIDNAAAAINNAIAGLKEKADYTTLNAAKSAAAKVDCETGNYTEESLTVFNTALANANAVSDDLSVDEQQTVNDAATALNDAIAALKIKADYTALENAKTAAAEKKNDGKVYTTATMSVLDSALTAAEGVAANLTIENQQTIDDAAAAINNAIAALKVKADYSALETAKADAAVKKADGKTYTADSMAALDSALNTANGISGDLSVDDQQTVDNAAAAINNAIAALKIPADYTALNAAKEAAAAKKNDGKVYTAESMAALDSALTAAAGVAANLTSESQQLIDDAAAAINNAIAALVEYVDPTQVNNIAIKFPNVDKFLYRVGNMNTVALSSLFEATGEVNSADVVLTVTNIEGNAAGAYTANTTAWQNGTVKFSGEGVVKVSISHNKAAATELYLEVVNAKNATTAQSATSNDVVLLNDVSSSGGFSVSGNHIFYGNGFKVSDTRTNTSGTQGFVTLNKARLDNVEIVGLEYPETVLSGTENQYYSPCANIGGDTEIYNCHISGCRFAVQIGRGNIIIENSLIEGGTNANIALNSGALTLKNSITSKSRNNTLQGLGIVVANRNAKLNIEGTFKQYNWLASSQIPSAYSSILKDMYNDSSFAYSSGGTKYVNMGVLFYNLDDTIGIAVAEDMLNDLTANSYGFKEKTVSGITGTAYTEKSAGITDADVGCCEYSTAGQYNTFPVTSFDYTGKNYIAKTADSNKYCYYDSTLKKVNISFESTDGSFAWDPMIFTASKYGTSYNYTVSMNGVDYTNRNIVFTASGDYEVVYTYTDINSCSMVGGNLTKDSKVYENTVYITVSAVDPEISAYHPQFTYASGSKTKQLIISNNTYIMPDVTGTSTTVGSTTVGGQTVYFPIVTVGPTSSNGNTAYSSGKGYYFAPAFSEVNITDYNQSTGAVQYTYNSSSKTWPHAKSAKNGPDAAVFGYDSGAAYANQPYGRSMSADYYGFGSNDKGLCYTCNEIEKDNAASEHLVKYHYVGNDGTTYYYYIKYSFTAMTYESCFATGTLITLADGSQKKIEDITFGDKILAWDFFTGTYVEKEISVLVYHGDDTYAVANTVYSDGTVLRTIGEHGVFDYDLNRFVYITAANCTDYIGHRFVKYNSNGSYDIVTMTDAYATTEVTGAYSLSSAGTSNAIAEGLLTVAPPEDFYNWIEMDGKLHYDVEQFNADVEKYGLYDYEVFSDYVTYEQFVAFNGAYLKIPVEKGLFTFDYIIELIDLYSEWMPE